MRVIVLTNGVFASVDDEDYEVLSAHRWSMIACHGLVYAGRRVADASKRSRQRLIYMHQAIMPCDEVDHRDGNGLNNQRSNLRPATHQQNTFNRKKSAGTTSRYKGVVLHRQSGKWRARIKRDGVTASLGLYWVEAEAARAYDAAARECYGEFARLNFPEET